MRRMAHRIGLIAVLLALSLVDGSALTVEIQLAPANTGSQKFAFQILCTDRDGMKEFKVTARGKKELLSPGLLARLYLSDGKTDYATVPVEETRDGDRVTYWFRVAPELLAKTRFEFSVLSGKEEKLPNGRTHFIAVPGTISYWFYVGDFAGGRAAVKPVLKSGRLRSARRAQ